MRIKLLVTATALLILPSVLSPAQVPKITSIGPEETAGAQGRLSTIATDAGNQPHIASDGGSYVYFYDKIGGTWQPVSLNVGNYGSSQYYNPHLEIDRNNIGWYSGILFRAGDVANCGIGMITRTTMSTAPGAPNFSRKHVDLSSWDTGMASVDMSLNRCTAYSSSGNWESYDYDPAVEGGSRSVGRGQLYAGRGGEANSIYISKANPVAHADGTTRAVWHVGTVGAPSYDPCMYQNSYRRALGQSPLAWLDPYTYGLGGDGVYAGLTTDNKDPYIAYLSLDASAHAGQGLYANVFNGQQMVRPANNVLLININGKSGTRYAPSMCPALNGGAFICYSVGNQMYIRYIGQDGTLGSEELICTGTLGALCTDSEGNIHLVYNNNGIKYRKITVFDAGVVSVPMFTGDFDGDGQSDVGVFRPSDGNWYILRSQAGPSARNWGTSRDIPMPYDFDGDRKADHAVYRRSDSTWYVSGSKDGDKAPVPWGTAEDTPVPGDYDGDGKTDIACYRATNGTWYIRRSTDLELDGRQWGIEGDIPLPGDYDGDGVSDTCVFRPSNATWYWWGSSNGYHQFQWGATNGDIPVPEDYDGDGATDVAVVRRGTGQWFIWGSTSGYRAYQWGSPGDFPVPGKFDPDSKTDIAIFRPQTSEWFIRRSTDGKIKGLPPVYWGATTDIPIPRNFNTDKKIEIAVHRGSAAGWYIMGKGNYTFGIPGDIAVPEDYDGDGAANLALYRPGSGTWYISTSNGTLAKQWGAATDTPVPGDYDGDGSNDVAVFRPGTGKWYIWGSSGIKTGTFWGTVGDKPMPGDYDGDKKTDIAVFRPGTATFYVWRSSKGYLEKQWGTSGDIPVPADYDQDGKVDVAVFRPSTGVWYMWSSKYSNIMTYQWGSPGDIPLPYDFDGDGKIDFSVFRPVGYGAWWIKKSSNGEIMEQAGPILWGTQGDLAIGSRGKSL